MNAFKAYKACVPISWSPNLYITLVRGIPGTRRLHRRTLEALRLRKCNRTMMRWNTPTVRGMLQQVTKLHMIKLVKLMLLFFSDFILIGRIHVQVKRLVVIETEEMFKARKQKEADHKALHPPLIINHPPESSS